MNQPILFWNYIVKLNHVNSISIYLRVFSMQCFERSAITVSLVLVQGNKHLNTFPDPKCGPKTKTSMFAFHLDRHESNYPRLCSAHFAATPSDSVWFGDLVTSFHASPRHLIYLSSQENPAAVPKSVLSFPNTLHPQGEIGREVEKCCFVSRAFQILLVRFSKIQHFPGYMMLYAYMPHSSHIFPGEITFSASSLSEVCPSSAGCLPGTPWSRSGGWSSAGSSRGSWWHLQNFGIQQNWETFQCGDGSFLFVSWAWLQIFLSTPSFWVFFW